MRKRNLLGMILLIIIIVIIMALITIINTYHRSLKPVNKEKDSETIIVDIKQGLSTSEIASLLEEENVIRNDFTFKIYVVLNGKKNFQAGKYEFQNGIDDVEEVIYKLTNGNVYDETVSITFLEGYTIEDYAEVISENTSNTKDDVLDLVNDKNYLMDLIDKYWFITDDILDGDLYYSLEGYILPDTYTFINYDVEVTEIFDVIFGYMEDFLDSNNSDIEKSQFSVHEILTLASMLELEAKTDSDREEVAGVFINRLNEGMSLGSDVTTYYAFGLDISSDTLKTKQINTYNPYNTRGPNMEGKLPVGPICNPSKSAIEAAINPKKTDAMYFVADINGDVYFSKTYDEHQEQVENLKSKGLWIE